MFIFSFFQFKKKKPKGGQGAKISKKITFSNFTNLIEFTHKKLKLSEDNSIFHILGVFGPKVTVGGVVGDLSLL